MIGGASPLARAFAPSSEVVVATAVLAVGAVTLIGGALPPARPTVAPCGAAPTLAMAKGAAKEGSASTEKKMVEA